MRSVGKNLGHWVLYAIFAVVLYFCFRIVQPFLMPILLALILSTLLAPVYETAARQLKNRTSLAAALVCVGLTIAILIPVLFLSILLAREANDAYRHLKDPQTLQKITTWIDPHTNPLLSGLQKWLPAAWRFENLELGAQLGSQAQRLGVAVLGLTTTFAAGAFGLLVDYFIMLVVLFFLLRDLSYFAAAARRISPLSEEEETHFVETFRRVSRATVMGNLVTALSQGFLSGLIFLALGLPNPILWGALTALLSLVPVVGTAVVWVPWTVYLLASGSTITAVIFLIIQVVAVGGIDNILRPMLIEGHVRMHTLVVFFSILGGINYFGILGMFLGPLVFAIAFAFIEFYLEDEVA